MGKVTHFRKPFRNEWGGDTKIHVFNGFIKKVIEIDYRSYNLLVFLAKLDACRSHIKDGP